MKKNAFTLIEILVAMAILVIVLVAALVIFRAAASSYRKGEIRAQRYQEARFVMERVNREIFSLTPLSASGPYCIGTEDALYFVTASVDAPGGLLEVGYRLDAQSRNLLRSYQFIPDYDYQTADEEEILCANVSRLAFEYADGENWQGSWDSRLEQPQAGRLPRAIKFEITIEDAKNSESFTTIAEIHR